MEDSDTKYKESSNAEAAGDNFELFEEPGTCMELNEKG